MMGEDRNDLERVWARVALGELPDEALDEAGRQQAGDGAAAARLEAMRRQLDLLPRLPRGEVLPHSVVVPPPSAMPYPPMPDALLARLKAIPDEAGLGEAARQPAGAVEVAGQPVAGAARAAFPTARGEARPGEGARGPAASRPGAWTRSARRSVAAGLAAAVLVAIGVWRAAPERDGASSPGRDGVILPGHDGVISPGDVVVKGPAGDELTAAEGDSAPAVELVLFTRAAPDAPVRPLAEVFLEGGGTGLAGLRGQVVLAVLRGPDGLTETPVYATVAARDAAGRIRVLTEGSSPVALRPVPDRPGYFTESTALKATLDLEPGAYRLFALLSPTPLAGVLTRHASRPSPGDGLKGGSMPSSEQDLKHVLEPSSDERLIDPADAPAGLVQASVPLVVR